VRYLISEGYHISNESTMTIQSRKALQRGLSEIGVSELTAVITSPSPQKSMVHFTHYKRELVQEKDNRGRSKPRYREESGESPQSKKAFILFVEPERAEELKAHIESAKIQARENQ
jgi:hypothetical protein